MLCLGRGRSEGELQSIIEEKACCTAAIAVIQPSCLTPTCIRSSIAAQQQHRSQSKQTKAERKDADIGDRSSDTGDGSDHVTSHHTPLSSLVIFISAALVLLCSCLSPLSLMLRVSVVSAVSTGGDPRRLPLFFCFARPFAIRPTMERPRDMCARRLLQLELQSLPWPAIGSPGGQQAVDQFDSHCQPMSASPVAVHPAAAFTSLYCPVCAWGAG